MKRSGTCELISIAMLDKQRSMLMKIHLYHIKNI